MIKIPNLTGMWYFTSKSRNFSGETDCTQFNNNTDILHCQKYDHLDILVQNHITEVKLYIIISNLSIYIFFLDVIFSFCTNSHFYRVWQEYILGVDYFSWSNNQKASLQFRSKGALTLDFQVSASKINVRIDWGEGLPCIIAFTEFSVITNQEISN